MHKRIFGYISIDLYALTRASCSKRGIHSMYELGFFLRYRFHNA